MTSPTFDFPCSDLSFGEFINEAKFGNIFGLNGCWLNKFGMSIKDFGDFEGFSVLFETGVWLLKKYAFEIPNRGEKTFGDSGGVMESSDLI